jgi:hypothetical protein
MKLTRETLTAARFDTLVASGWNVCPCGTLFWFPRSGPHGSCKEATQFEAELRDRMLWEAEVARAA